MKGMTYVEFRRRELGLPMHRLAYLSGVKIETIRQVEHRSITPTQEQAVQLARALDVPVSRIWLTGKSHKTQPPESESDKPTADGQLDLFNDGQLDLFNDVNTVIHELTCTYCHHNWIVRIEEPKQCPACHQSLDKEKPLLESYRVSVPSDDRRLSKTTTVRLSNDILIAMEELQDRDGMPPSEQIRRALREWLKTKLETVSEARDGG